MFNKEVLVLNQNYEPLNVCSAKRAIILIFLGKAEIVAKHNAEIHSVSMSFPLPSIVRLASYIYHPFKELTLSKQNIFKRDEYRCQYCGANNRSMTIDHVVPRRLGGKETWDNLVCACVKCNNKKGNRTPEQAGLKLLKQPRKPKNVTFAGKLVKVSDHRWKPYLFME